MRALVMLMCLAACEEPVAKTGPCQCTPHNASRVKLRGEDAPMDGVSLLARLQRHARDVRLGRNARDIKVGDDELRLAIANFCEPCNGWVPDRSRIEDLYPLDRLDQAARAVCLGLVMHDGTTVYGDARPRTCR